MTDQNSAKYFLAAIVESSKDSIVTVDFNNVITTWNKAAEKLYGYPAAEAVGRPLSMVILPEDMQQVLSNVEKIKHGKEVVQFEQVRVRKGGEHINLEIVLSPVRNEADEVIGVSTIARDITPHIQAQEALHESEERLQKAITIKTVGVMFFNMEGIIYDGNDAFLRMSGYSLEQLESGNVRWEDLTPPEFMEASRKAVQELLAKGENTPYEKQYIRPDGSRWWGLFSGKRLSEKEGVEFIIDITQRKEAEEALRESEHRSRLLADAIPHIIWTNDARGIANYFNKRWYEYTGLSEEKSIGPGWQAVVHPDNAPASKEKWRQALSKMEPFDAEYQLRRHDGHYRWFIGRNVPLLNAAGELEAWFGSATDIHDLKLAQENLRESEERLRITLESAVDHAIITTDTKGRIMGWSTGAQRIFGYREEEVLRKTTDFTFTPEDQAAGVPKREILIAREEGRALDERWHQRRDGSSFFMNGVMAPIYNNGLIGYVKVARDMTEQKLIEMQREEFIGIASHELRTPVTSIQAFAEVLGEMFEESGDAQSVTVIQKMGKQVDRLTELVGALLDVTQIRGDQLQLQHSIFPLDELIAETTETMQQITSTHRLTLHLDAACTVLADRERIRQVLINIIGNAIKYSPEAKEVIVRSSEKDGQVAVCIQDFGIGIGEESQQKIFERFYRGLDSETTTYPGLGLGLYITAEIVRRHGGEVMVESRKGEGSTFCFTLPTTG